LGKAFRESKEEFDEDMADFAGVDADAGEIGGELELDLDVVLGEFDGNGMEGLFEEFGEVVELNILLAVGSEFQEALDDGVGLARRVFEVGEHQLTSRGIRAARAAEAFSEKIDSKENGLERVSDFVGDAGGEGAQGLDFLGLNEAILGGVKVFVGLLELAEGFSQLIHSLAMFGDVAGDHHDLVRLAQFVPDDVAEGLDVADPAVGQEHAVFGALALAGAERFAEHGLDAGAVFGMDFVERIGAGEARGSAEAVFVGGVVVQAPAVAVDNRDEIGHVLGDQAEELFALAEAGFDMLAFDRATGDSQQFAMIETAYGDVIFRALADGAERGVVIIGVGQQYDGEVRSGLPELSEGSQAGAGGGVGAQQEHVKGVSVDE
jgi:hypothetical protein